MMRKLDSVSDCQYKCITQYVPFYLSGQIAGSGSFSRPFCASNNESHKLFQSSYTSTLWYYVQAHYQEALGSVCVPVWPLTLGDHVCWY